jgi:hemerythrin-like domain-containing protein
MTMLPVGPLMIEHRLIERMIDIMKRETDQIEKIGEVNTELVEKAVDFIRTYADRCHHGKEENILFRELKKKNLSEEHAQMIQELEKDHRWGRKTTGELAEARERYLKGDEEALSSIVINMRSLVDLYPKHIKKEDKHFFLQVMDYFTDGEKQSMLNEGYEFDRTLIHLKYKAVVQALE